MANRSDKRRSRPATKRQYPRTARLNTLLQEIVADHMERADDEQLVLFTVTGVEVDADLNKAVVYFTTLADESRDAEILEILEERHRKPIQANIARSARLRKTPEVVFAFDPAIRTGARIEHILATLTENDEPASEPADEPADEPASEPVDRPVDDPAPERGAP